MPSLSKPQFLFLKELLHTRLIDHWRESGFNKKLEEYIMFPKYGEAARIYYFTSASKPGVSFPNLKRPEGSLPDMMLRHENVCEYLIENGVENNDKNWPLRPEAQILRWDKGEFDEKILDKIAFKAYLTYIGIEDFETFKKKFEKWVESNEYSLNNSTQEADIKDSYPQSRSSAKQTSKKIWGYSLFSLIIFCAGALIRELNCFNASQYDDSTKLLGISKGKLAPMYDSICGYVIIECNQKSYFIRGKRSGLYIGSTNILKDSMNLAISKVIHGQNSLFFKFAVDGIIDQSEGFVDLEFSPMPEVMTGKIIYLFKDSERHWGEVNITFKRPIMGIINCEAINDPLCITGKWYYKVVRRR